jgi:hypothetical protein
VDERAIRDLHVVSTAPKADQPTEPEAD